MQVEFCGEWTALDPEAAFTIGRDGDVEVDDNPYLHRWFLILSQSTRCGG